MSQGETIRHSTLWVMAGGMGLQVLNFLVGIVLARLLVPADFGMIVTIQIFTGIAAFMASGGMGIALVRAKEIEERDWDVVFTAQLLVGMLIYAVFFVMAPHLSTWYGNELYGHLLRVSAVSFLLRPFSNIPLSKLQRHMRFKYRVIAQVATQSCAMATSVSLAVAGAGVWSLTLSGLVGGVVGFVVAARLAQWRPRFDLNRSRIKVYMGYGYLISANDLVDYLKTQTTNFVLSRTSTPAMVGLYNKADSLFMTPVTLISGSLYQPILRALAAEQDSQPATSYLYLRSVTLLSTYMGPLYVAALFAASSFLVTLYGPAWASSAEPLRILALSGFFVCIGHPASAVLLALGQVRQEIKVALLAWAVLLVGLLFGFKAGLAGVAVAVALSHVIGSLALGVLACKLLKINARGVLRAIRPSIVVSAWVALAMAATELALDTLISTRPWLHLVCLAASWALSFGMVLLVFTPKGLESEAVRWRKRLLGKRVDMSRVSEGEG